jgi:hypothetical protein
VGLPRHGRGAVPTVVLSVAALLAAPAASADTVPAQGTPATASADALPTWQVNGVVWSMATIGNTAYAVGDFTRARPPGTAPGAAGEKVRNNILAFDLRTGNLLTSWWASLNGQALRIKAAPDGSKIYVGGDFTRANGEPRSRLAAFDARTGALDPAFKPTVSARVSGIAVTGNTVYFGGAFFAVNGTSRTRLAAVSRSHGALLPWRPTADDEVHALASVAGNRVIVGGRFQRLNGTAKVGVGAVNGTDGASATWTSRPIPTAEEGGKERSSWVTDLINANGVVYGAANGNGLEVFDGRFAAKAENGNLIWLDNCYGATYGLFLRAPVLYSVSHAHDCGSLGAWEETDPQTVQRALAETSYTAGTDRSEPSWNANYSKQPIPGLLHWYPSLAMGSYTQQFQGAWAITGNAEYLALGGEFPRVNGRAQYGLTRFRVKAGAPNKMGPEQLSSLKPTLDRVSGGVKVTWKSTWDRDNHNLRYEVLRGTSVRHTVTVGSNFWSMPARSFSDSVSKKGTYSYRIRVSDPLGNTWTGPATSIKF